MSTQSGSKEVCQYLEVIKWLIVNMLLGVAIFGNYYYSDVNLLLRTTVVIITVVVSGAVAVMTKKGQSIVSFYHEARIEVRKVIWPTQQETLHSTLIVIAVTAIISIILWGLDSILVRLVSFSTGLRL